MKSTQPLNVLESMTPRTGFDPYLTLRALSAHSGMSIRTLRKALTDPAHPLPHYRPRCNRILVRRSDFDRWMAHFHRDGSDLDQLVSEIVKKVV